MLKYQPPMTNRCGDIDGGGIHPPAPHAKHNNQGEQRVKNEEGEIIICQLMDTFKPLPK